MRRGGTCLGLVLAVLGCNRTLETCRSALDCAPPASVCGPAGTCVLGCAALPEACLPGTCDPASGECIGSGEDGGPSETGGQGEADARDEADLGPSVDDDLGQSGDDAGRTLDLGPRTDAWTDGGSTAPDAQPDAGGMDACQRDLDCAPSGYCTPSGACATPVLMGRGACAGGTTVTRTCAIKTTAAAFAACAGPPGPATCPYCIDNACFDPRLCTTRADCHKGNACTAGLCIPDAPQCPSTMTVAQLEAQAITAGREVCLRDMVSSVRTGTEGLVEIKLGTTPALYADLPDMYAAQGVATPVAGQPWTLHGMIRWDDTHMDWELLPVDWTSP